MNFTATSGSSQKEAIPRSKRSRLEDALRQTLLKSGYPPLWSIACCSQAGTAVLTGQVPTYYLKQVAQTLVLDHAGIHQVDNLLDVVPNSNLAQCD